MDKKWIFSVCIFASLLASSLSSSIYHRLENDEHNQHQLQQQQQLDSIEDSISNPVLFKRAAAPAPRKRVISPDEKLQKMTLAFIKYLQILKSSQVDSNTKKVVYIQLTELIDEIARHIAEHPRLEHSILNMIKNPSALISDDASGSDDGKSKDVTPFKWGK